VGAGPAVGDMHITLALFAKAAKRRGFTALTSKRGPTGYYKAGAYLHSSTSQLNLSRV
jgi:hypothetical protein